MSRFSHMATPAGILLILAAVVAAIAAPHSGADPEAQRLILKWIEAVGGHERVASIKATYTRVTFETAGMKGTALDWSTVRGEMRQEATLGTFFRSVTVFDGEQGWVQDHNGQVKEIGGSELEDQITSNYLNTLSHLVGGRMPGRIAYAGTDDGLEILEIEPDGGRTFKVMLDPETGLPVRQVFPAGDRKRIVTMSDWRDVDGFMIAHRAHETTGDPKYDVIVTLEEVVINPDIDPALFTRPSGGEKDYRFTSGESALNIPIQLNSNHIYVEARINGEGPLWFILDTGAGVTVISRERAEEMGLQMEGKIEGRGAGEGSVDVSIIPGVSFELQGVELTNQTVMAIALKALEPYEGRPIEGILGYDMISRFVLQIDYADRRMHLYEPETFQADATVVSVPFTLEDNQPHVMAQVAVDGRAPITGKFLIDTGSRSALSLNRPFCEEHDLTDGLVTIRGGFGAGVGGETKNAIGRVDALKLGDYVLHDVVGGFSEDEGGALADPDVAGIVGGDALRRFNVTFDYSRYEMLLVPNGHFEEGFEYDMAGVFLATSPGFDRFKVHKVIAESPCGEAGLIEGDIITAIDGRPAEKYSLEEVRQMFREEGRECTLDVEDGDRVRQVKIKMRRLI